MWDIFVLNWRNRQADTNLRPPRETGWLSAVSMSHWFRLCVSQSPPLSPTELFNMFEGLWHFSSGKGRAFLLPTLEVVLVGRKENGSAWGCRAGWCCCCCCSEVCLVGPELYWLERKPAELRGPENLDERKLLKLPTSALERWAAIQCPLPAYTNTPTNTHIKQACISKQTNTHSWLHTQLHTCIHSYLANTHTQTHFGFLFICWSARWAWALIGPGGYWQGEWSNEEARFSRDKQQEGEWQEEKGHHSTSREGTTTEEGK